MFPNFVIMKLCQMPTYRSVLGDGICVSIEDDDDDLFIMELYRSVTLLVKIFDVVFVSAGENGRIKTRIEEACIHQG
jgi:hypothetical protein